MNRRHLLAAGAAALAVPAQAQQHQHLRPAAPSPHRFHSLQGGTPHHLTPQQEAQRVTGSPAPAGPPGRWVARADMPIPRSEMAWATAWEGRMHVVGGYGEGQVNRAYHTVYVPAEDRWYDAAPLPRGANHVAVVAHAGRVYALGGFIEQCEDVLGRGQAALDGRVEIGQALEGRIHHKGSGNERGKTTDSGHAFSGLDHGHRNDDGNRQRRRQLGDRRAQSGRNGAAHEDAAQIIGHTFEPG